MGEAARPQFNEHQVGILAELADALAVSQLRRVLRFSCTVRGCQASATQLLSVGLIESQLCSRHAHEHQLRVDRAFYGGPLEP